MNISRKKVIIEIRVPQKMPDSDVLTFFSEQIDWPGFELDADYEPIPAAPVADLEADLVAPNEKLMTVRGTLDERHEEQLKKIPCVFAVWTDATVEPFDE